MFWLQRLAMRVHLCVVILHAPGEFHQWCRTVQTDLLPRVGDHVRGETLGDSFVCEGAKVEGVTLDLQTDEVWVYLEKSNMWRFLEECPDEGPIEDAIARHYVGFTKMFPEPD